MKKNPLKKSCQNHKNTEHKELPRNWSLFAKLGPVYAHFVVGNYDIQIQNSKQYRWLKSLTLSKRTVIWVI